MAQFTILCGCELMSMVYNSHFRDSRPVSSCKSTVFIVVDRTIGDVGLLDLGLFLQEGEGVIDDPGLLDELLELRLVVLQLSRHLGNR